MTTDREAWLQERKKGIGGSDVAGILGLSKWSTPYSVYADKRGESNDRDDTVDMLIGRALEPWLFSEYKRITGSDIEKVDRILYDEEYPFLLANVDGLRSDRVVEFKKSRDKDGWGFPGTDEVPVQYLLQSQHYMRVTKKQTCDLGVFFQCSRVPEVVLYHIDRDDDLIDMIIPKLVEFWRCVQEGEAPAAISSSDAQWKYKKSEPIAVEADDSIWEAVSMLRQVRADIDLLEGKKDALEARIKEHMQNAEALRYGKTVLATWRTAKDSSKIDGDRLRKERPDIAKEFSKTQPGARKFLLK